MLDGVNALDPQSSICRSSDVPRLVWSSVGPHCSFALKMLVPCRSAGAAVATIKSGRPLSSGRRQQAQHSSGGGAWLQPDQLETATAAVKKRLGEAETIKCELDGRRRQLERQLEQLLHDSLPTSQPAGSSDAALPVDRAYGDGEDIASLQRAKLELDRKQHLVGTLRHGDPSPPTWSTVEHCTHLAPAPIVVGACRPKLSAMS